MDRTYNITFSDGSIRTIGYHNADNTDEPMTLADVLLYLVGHDRISLDDIIKIELIPEGLIQKDLNSKKCKKVKIYY